MNELDLLYEDFKTKVIGVDAECYRVNSFEKLAEAIISIFKEKGIKTVSLLESPITKASSIQNILVKEGFEVHTDNFHQTTATDDVGITEVQYGIAELGTFVQTGREVDNRLCSTYVPIHIALLKTSNIVVELDDMMEILYSKPQIPSFVGFVTGPSRSTDIERILAIGVHGPKEVIIICVDE